MRTHRSLRQCWLSLLAAFALVLAAPAARGDPTHHHELKNTETPFLAVELGGSLLFSGALLLAAGPPATQCAWCASNGFDEAVRDWLLADNPRGPALASHALSMGAAPALALGALIPPALAAGNGREALENVVISLDTVILTFGLTHATKRIFDRQRPAAHHNALGVTEYGDSPDQWNQSFFSGDTSVAFALAASATTLSYLRGYPSAPYVLALGSLIAVGTGGLRIAADMHWATDVLTGAAVGTAIGFGLPYLLHPRKDAPADATSMMVMPQVSRAELGVVWGGSF